MLLVFRALCGLAAAMTVPSAISILVQTFPERKEKDNILGIFGAMGAIGNCAGIVIGGVVSAQLSWRWVFYLIAIVIIPFSIASFFLLPKEIHGFKQNKEAKAQSLDLPGITVLTGGLILFVYAISDGNTEGWGSPQIITTLVLSVVLFAAFFVVERFVKDPALPSSTWSNKNFTPMFFYAWRYATEFSTNAFLLMYPPSIYWFFFVIELQFSQLFQDLWHWSPLSAALHAIPIGTS